MGKRVRDKTIPRSTETAPWYCFILRLIFISLHQRKPLCLFVCLFNSGQTANALPDPHPYFQVPG